MRGVNHLYKVYETFGLSKVPGFFPGTFGLFETFAGLFGLFLEVFLIVFYDFEE